MGEHDQEGEELVNRNVAPVINDDVIVSTALVQKVVQVRFLALVAFDDIGIGYACFLQALGSVRKTVHVL
eukprot:7560588-Pyramimonas_sp.AAC.1